MNCKNCGSLVKENAKFCGKCGTSTLPPERRCQACNTKLDLDDLFCYNCGTKFNETKLTMGGFIIEEQFTALSEAVNEECMPKTSSVKTGVLMNKEVALKFKKNIPDEEKSIVKKIKKATQYEPTLFLYDTDNNRIYMKYENNIGVFAPSNMLMPIIQYSVSSAVWDFWKNTTYKPKNFYFFNNSDAFLAWDSYLFISVYKGEIRWGAADRRDQGRLPIKASQYLGVSGDVKLEELGDGIFICSHFFDGKMFKVDKGIFIPIE